jgi:hypothetical protein
VTDEEMKNRRVEVSTPSLVGQVIVFEPGSWVVVNGELTVRDVNDEDQAQFATGAWSYVARRPVGEDQDN